MDILGKLFGSESKVRIMRLFLFNPDTPFTNEDVAERAKCSLASTRHELSVLRKIRLIRSRGFMKRILRKNKKKHSFIRKSVWGWSLNQSFPYLSELQRLLIDSSLVKEDELLRKLNPAGRLKLVLMAGIFIQDGDSRVDLLVVGDHLKRSTLERAMKGIEADMGTELRYAAFETAEFNYRLGMYDKLIRDILDYRHTVVLDRFGLPPMGKES